jgi:predicted nicotinamide N-methyase
VTLETELRQRFDTREERFVHAGWQVDVLLPRAADALIDETEFDADERLPYWADLWPSARALARHLLDHPPPERTAIELGAGVALPSLALMKIGVSVRATDWYDDALRFARVNAERNGLGALETGHLDWLRHDGGAHYPLVIAADVLYEVRNADALAAVLPRLVAPGGRALVADPGRVYERGFRNRMTLAGWAVREVGRREEISDPASGATSTVRIFELRPAAAS